MNVVRHLISCLLILVPSLMPFKACAAPDLAPPSAKSVIDAIERSRRAVRSMSFQVDRFDDTQGTSIPDGSERFAFKGDKRFIELVQLVPPRKNQRPKARPAAPAQFGSDA